MDSSIYPDSPALRRIINRHTKDSLIDIAVRWITIYALTRLEAKNQDSHVDTSMDNVAEATNTEHMTTAQYQQHVEKEYQTMRDKSTKKRVADRILGVDWSLGLTARQVADLDLAYYQEHAHLKTWKALRLDYKDQGICNQLLLEMCL